MTRVLVTGGAGYLGSILCAKLLAAGHSVVAVDNLLYGDAALFHLCSVPEFEFVRGDVRDTDVMSGLLAKADVVIPLAAIVGAPACDRDPRLAQAVNLDAIRWLVERASPDQIIVYPTTNSGYGTQSGEAFCTEETPLEPISLYGRTKAQAEAAVLGHPNGIALRLATVFGPSPRMRLDLLVNHFVHAAVTDGYLVLFEGHFKRNYVHIGDVADCFCFCLDAAATMRGGTFNLGLDSANLTKCELARKVQEYVPRLAIHSSEFGTDPDKRNYIVSSRKLRDAGFSATRSLDLGITQLLRAYRMMGRGHYFNA